MLATGGGKAGLGDVIPTDGRQAAQSLGQACVASNDCLRIGMGLVATMARVDPARREVQAIRSADTLNPSDFGPPWSAPGGRRAVTSGHLHPGTLARL